MGRRITVTLLATIASLVLAGPAHATVYFVQTTTDGAGSCAAEANGPYSRCDTLRAAVTASNSSPDEDVIYLQAIGDYKISNALDLDDNVFITGRGPRLTSVSGTGTD